jgi:hypothetical protein
MANFLKVKAGPVANDGIETLIPIDGIAGFVVASTGSTSAAITTATVTLDSGSPGSYAIVVDAPVGGSTGFTAGTREKQLTEALNAALTANPGGVVSTLVPPLTTPQVPAAKGDVQGRIVVTQAAVYNQFKTCTYTP